MWSASAIYCVPGKIQIPHVGLACFLLKVREVLFLHCGTNPKYRQSSWKHCCCFQNPACVVISVYGSNAQDSDLSQADHASSVCVCTRGTRALAHTQVQWNTDPAVTVCRQSYREFREKKVYCYFPTFLPNKWMLAHLPRKQTLFLLKMHTPCCLALFLAGEQLFQPLPERIFPVDIVNHWEPTPNTLQSSSRHSKAWRLWKCGQ